MLGAKTIASKKAMPGQDPRNPPSVPPESVKTTKMLFGLASEHHKCGASLSWLARTELDHSVRMHVSQSLQYVSRHGLGDLQRAIFLNTVQQTVRQMRED